MSGSNLLLDTNVILYFLKGDRTLLTIFEENNLFVSVITEIELLSYSELTKNELVEIKLFLEQCSSINLSDSIKLKAIEVRKEFGFKIPDAIILASSMIMNSPLLTADRDFKAVESADVILYEHP